jgi:hypothetical protein
MKVLKQLSLCAVFLLVSLATPVFAAPQTNCPVMGGEVNKDLYVDVEGKRIYVCCPYCIGEIKKDPAKYIAKAEADGQELEAAPQ